MRKQWTRAECALLEESGLWDGQHFELIEGELYNKMGKKRPHVNASTFLREWLTRWFGGVFGTQQIQSGIFNEPDTCGYLPSGGNFRHYRPIRFNQQSSALCARLYY